jgi:hypothetical protein
MQVSSTCSRSLSSATFAYHDQPESSTLVRIVHDHVVAYARVSWARPNPVGASGLTLQFHLVRELSLPTIKELTAMAAKREYRRTHSCGRSPGWSSCALPRQT